MFDIFGRVKKSDKNGTNLEISNLALTFVEREMEVTRKESKSLEKSFLLLVIVDSYNLNDCIIV